MHTDVLIVGQGLAGSALAWRLAERGIDALVVDRGGVDFGGLPSSSHVAAGLITPITGKRMTLAPDWPAMRSAAQAFYQQVEQTTGAHFFAVQPALRLFLSRDERQNFLDRRDAALYGDQALLADGLAANADQLPTSLQSEWGGFWMPTAARLDSSAYLQATRDWLIDRRRYLEAELDAKQLSFTDDRVVAGNLEIAARRVVFCQGACSRLPASVAPLPLAPVKGEIIALQAPQLKLPCVAHRGVWIASDSGKGPNRYLVGATYNRSWHDTGPTAAGKAELMHALKQMVKVPTQLAGHYAAIRPAAKRRNPLAGISPTEPRIAWLNGLGAKGALWAPWYAEMLARLIAAA